MTFGEVVAQLKTMPSGGEWYHEDDYETYVELAEKMFGTGLEPAMIFEILAGAYFAAASEFGS